ncbi:GNAT family N-acetyltransferase [Plantactinospora sp. S1510]|uniref:GNAT family N-acetyltransferase n=1 Tax=Plantactinospora alkalitolerans TaxID=2789879 RepID=A0ABS0H138_9ACTN|nr:GNAT family N-acetyltransferase [Plantactinospora alkalitolerans]MBF9132150.1 GNAT family N-acetyltransferase [Plantactinospora alkalitolerans]
MDIIVQRSVVAQLSQRPQSVEVGPFVIGWDPSTDSRYINYATPRPDAVITNTDVARLVAAFREIDRLPRLEYVTTCAPGLERQLLDAGFGVEARHDYLVCSPDSLTMPAVPDGFEIAEPATDEDRAGAVAAQNEAFGGEPTATPADVARIRRTQDNGGVVMYARGPDGSYVGGGQASPPGEGVTEVAGIAVRDAFRRRGIAGALTAGITARMFANGVQGAWLEASGEDSWRVYERVGYAATGKRLYIALG